MQGGGGSQLSRSPIAFTMAEILLSLTIIGVVAAITLPSLTGNINERTWNTQRKALYARMSQAISLMPQINGYGTLTEDESGCVTEDNATEAFITSGLSKVLKINNICDSSNLADCGIAPKITTLAGSTISQFPATLVGLNSRFNGSYFKPGNSTDSNYYSQANTKAAAFETANGESIVAYYNPRCKYDTARSVTSVAYPSSWAQPYMCANFIYDLNGSKGPNTVGKDIGFITVLYPSDPIVVAPMPLRKLSESATQTDAISLCKKLDSDSRMPNIEELAAIFYNKPLIDSSYEGISWSSSVYSVDKAWYQELGSGGRTAYNKSAQGGVICVKR